MNMDEDNIKKRKYKKTIFLSLLAAVLFFIGAFLNEMSVLFFIASAINILCAIIEAINYNKNK